MDVVGFMFIALVLLPCSAIVFLVLAAFKSRMWGLLAVAAALSIFPLGYLTFAYLIWFMPGH